MIHQGSSIFAVVIGHIRLWFSSETENNNVSLIGVIFIENDIQVLVLGLLRGGRFAIRYSIRYRLTMAMRSRCRAYYVKKARGGLEESTQTLN